MILNLNDIDINLLFKALNDSSWRSHWHSHGGSYSDKEKHNAYDNEVNQLRSKMLHQIRVNQSYDPEGTIDQTV